MLKYFFELQEKVVSYYPDANTEILKKAYTVAAQAHMHQLRASNEPYIIHPLAVAATLTEMKLDEISIAAAMLHDVVEDTDTTIEEIKKAFGEEISEIVWGVTKISKIQAYDAENAKAETLKKMIVAMTNDVRVILIKLADRLHNIKTLEALPSEKRIRIAKETLEIYAPIAYRLGIGKIKEELENTSFRHAYPEEYERIKGGISSRKIWAHEKLERIKSNLEGILEKFSIKGDISFRIKREISIYRKLLRQNIDLDKVYDLLALRVITDSIEHCYTIMGEIHQRWQHIPSRWRDFIAHPKNNGYQSIHTTIISTDGTKFEIQIRTRSMHRIAEEGIAAHWKYKEGISFLENDQRLQWFRDMIDTHRHNPNPKDFMSLIKKELTPNEIFVFTPKGKIINLSAGATPIDFAYAIHTEVGNHCKGAIVNEHLVPLRTKLNSGDVVEVETSNSASPSLDWLKFAVTTKARKKITAFIQKQEFQLFLTKGKRVWIKHLRELKRVHKFTLKEDDVEHRIARLHYKDLDTFLKDLGSGHRILDRKTLKILFPETGPVEVKVPVKQQVKKKSTTYKLVKVEGISGMEITFARCCNPIKGDPVRGYITLNRGMVIHKSDCQNIKNLIPSRLMTVEWNDDNDHVYQVKYDIISMDKPGVLNSISKITTDHNSNIKQISTEPISQNTVKMKMTFEVRDTEQLSKIYKAFTALKDVISVKRRRIAVK